MRKWRRSFVNNFLKEFKYNKNTDSFQLCFLTPKLCCRYFGGIGNDLLIIDMIKLINQDATS